MQAPRADLRDVVPRVAVEGLLEALLVEEVADEADGASEHEEAVEAAVVDQLVGLLLREGAARAQHVHEAHGDAPVHVEDERVTLLGRDLLHLLRGTESKTKMRGSATELHARV